MKSLAKIPGFIWENFTEEVIFELWDLDGQTGICQEKKVGKDIYIAKEIPISI